MEYTIAECEVPVRFKNGKIINVIFDEITITCNPSKDGIGGYEYWGACGYDDGNWMLEDFEIESAILNGKNMSEKVLELIDGEYLDKKYGDNIIETIENQESYY